MLDLSFRMSPYRPRSSSPHLTRTLTLVKYICKVWTRAILKAWSLQNWKRSKHWNRSSLYSVSLKPIRRVDCRRNRERRAAMSTRTSGRSQHFTLPPRTSQSHARLSERLQRRPSRPKYKRSDSSSSNRYRTTTARVIALICLTIRVMGAPKCNRQTSWFNQTTTNKRRLWFQRTRWLCRWWVFKICRRKILIKSLRTLTT